MLMGDEKFLTLQVGLQRDSRLKVLDFQRRFWTRLVLSNTYNTLPALWTDYNSKSKTVF